MSRPPLEFEKRHNNGPICFVGPGGNRLPIPRTDGLLTRHYPERHMGMILVAYCDGHVEPARPAELAEDRFNAD